MKLILSIAFAFFLQGAFLNGPVHTTPTVTATTASVGDEVVIVQAGNPFKCVIWRLSDKKKYQKYCR